jgi:hypothetical protein
MGARGLKGVTPHSLRHSFCKNLVNAGVSLEKIAALEHSAVRNSGAIRLARRRSIAFANVLFGSEIQYIDWQSTFNCSPRPFPRR